MRPARGVDPAAWGIATGYVDASGRWRPTPPATVAALLDALGADSPAPPSLPPSPLVVRGRLRRRLPRPAELVLEDGTVVGRVEEVPAGLPVGYHVLVTDAGPRPLLVSPGRCFLPDDLRAFGLAVQLYALRSRESWGIGDLADLRALASWASADLGAAVLLLNPLHAPAPTLPQQPSPYFPSSRLFRNPLLVRVEDVEGAELLEDSLEPLVRAGRALTRERLIDHDRIFRLKLEALEKIWTARTRTGWRPLPDDDDLAPDLRDFATYCALAEVHGPCWRRWPEGLRHPRSPEVERFRAAHRNRVHFFAWIQRLVEEQLARASESIALVHDLAVGIDPEGADAWMWQDLVADGVTVGAPPDEFALAGQDWGLAAFDPWKLRAAGYRPFAATLRAALSGAGGVRIDHVMGLFRLFWIPRGRSPAEGGYVHYPARDLLDVVAIESVRARAWVCGEDLGTVEETMREELRRRRILSYRLLWFEAGDPSTYPEEAVAAVTTHDLPTVVGLWTGSDLDAQRSAGLVPNEDGWRAVRSRLAALAGVDEGAPVEDVVTAAYIALGRAPSRVLLATLDDCLAVAERPNMPGTVDTWPNWRLALPATVEEIREHPLPLRVAAALRRDRSGQASPGA